MSDAASTNNPAFIQAAKEARSLDESLTTQDDLLELYGLFKQAIIGDVNTSKPGLLDPTGRAKHAAWSSRKDMSKEDAQAAYVALVEKLKARTS